MSHGVKEIRKKLDAVANDHNRFGFKLDSQPIRRQGKDTCSHVIEQNIIGREEDKERITSILLDSNVQLDVSFLTIVGMGGLGKTTLAQLVYNHERVTKGFDLRLWACVSDEDPKHLDVKAILCKILESAICQKHEGSSMDVLQSQLRKKLAGKKYLLVLDDVWNENRDEWINLVGFLKGGVRGSWVVVTTRSKETAQVVGVGPTYELKGLSEQHSWRLFESIAFEQGEGQASPTNLIEIGQKIVRKCANVPLAIRVIGSLLYRQGKDKWKSFQKMGLAKIRPGQNGILPILKLSYHHLESPLKSCFSYCALFPKDFEIKKEDLISLWMAQGFIVPLDEGQSIEDAAEEYFLILLRRCFFQEVEKDISGVIMSCKLHDLMHDIAQDVAGKEVCAVNLDTSNLDEKTRHISLLEGKCTRGFLTKTKVRTFLLFGLDIQLHVDKLLVNWMCLRTLDLSDSNITSLPDTIGNLLHLRYLDLCDNNLEALPNSITKLHNLQTLKLKWCFKLKKLPNDLSKLVKLRLLDIEGCNRLTHMPSGMGKLNSLRWLTMFVVGEASRSSMQGVVDQLEDLKALTDLKGCLEIRIQIPEKAAYVKKSSTERGYLRSKQSISYIHLKWENIESDENGDYEEELMEDLQPHPNLRGLLLEGYSGIRMPSWIREGYSRTFFPDLVEISLSECHELQCLSGLGKLRHLRFLKVQDLRNLEYMENTSGSTSNDAGASEWSIARCTTDISFFPSLEELQLEQLPKLKGWWRHNHNHNQQHQLLDDSTSTSSSRQPSLLSSFSRLSLLSITGCPELTSIPLCPRVEDLTLKEFNKRLQVIMSTGRDLERGPTFSSNSSFLSLSLLDSGNSKLRRVSTDNVRGLKSGLLMEALQCLTEMRIIDDTEVESLEEVDEVFHSCSSSLRSLIICGCYKLRSLCGGMAHLTALETLYIQDATNLTLNNAEEGKGKEDDGMPWQPLHQSLHSLDLWNLPKLVKLPKGMQHLTSIQSLKIRDCQALKSLPEWMQNFTSLRRLEVRACSEDLMQRCQSPTGEDRPYIQHIPYVVITRGEHC